MAPAKLPWIPKPSIKSSTKTVIKCPISINFWTTLAKSSLHERIKKENVWFIMLDVRYAYGQVPLSPETSQQCNFSIVGGQATGTYRFKTGFYGLADMPAEFQQTLDMILNDMPNLHAFIDDILIVSCGLKEDHIQLVDQALHRLDQANMSLKLSNVHFYKRKWIGWVTTLHLTAPHRCKISTILDMEYPKSHKQLKSFTGAINQFNKFFPNLALHSSPLRPLLTEIMNSAGRNHTN